MIEWNDITLIAPGADIDIAMVPSLRRRVDEAVAAGGTRIIVNCQDVGFIDSSGLAFLLSAARDLGRRGGMLSLVNASADVVRFLQIARLIDALHVSAADKPPVPVLAPDASPLWSKSVSVRSGVENLGYYRHRVVEMLEELSLGSNDRYDVALAVGEALGNAYDHAGGTGIVMTVRAYADRVVIEVADTGRGFELAADEVPLESEERGRGIKLMRMLVDSVEVRRRTDASGTIVCLIKLM